MDGRVHAAGELRIACTRGCAAGGSAGWSLHHADLVFWSVCPCLVHVQLSQSLGILTRTLCDRRGRV